MSAPGDHSECSSPRSIPIRIRRLNDDIGFTGSPTAFLSRGDINLQGDGDNRCLFDFGSQVSGSYLSSSVFVHVHGLDGSNDDLSSAPLTPSDDSEFGSTGQSDGKGKGKKSRMCPHVPL